MIFYSLFFILCILFSLNFKYVNITNNNINIYTYKKFNLWFVLVLILSLVIGLRYKVGADYLSYLDSYNKYKQGYNLSFEFGYEMLNKISIYMGFGYTFVLLASSFITNFFIIKTIKDKSNNFFLSIVILFGSGFIIFQTNGIRQAIAISLIFYSIRYIERNNVWKFILFSILASLFHLSALIMVPFYWLSKIELKKISLILILSGSIIIMFLNLNEVISFFINLLPDFFYKNYINYIFSNPSRVNTGIRIIFESILFFVIILNLKANIKRNKLKNILFNLTFYGIILRNIIGKYWGLNRIPFYFLIFQIILIPLIIKDLSINKYFKILIIIFVLLYYIFMFFYEVNISKSIIPYDIVFNN